MNVLICMHHDTVLRIEGEDAQMWHVRKDGSLAYTYASDCTGLMALLRPHLVAIQEGQVVRLIPEVVGYPDHGTAVRVGNCLRVAQSGFLYSPAMQKPTAPAS